MWMCDPLESKVGISPRKIWTAKIAVRKVMRNTKTMRLRRPDTFPKTICCHSSQLSIFQGIGMNAHDKVSRDWNSKHNPVEPEYLEECQPGVRLA